MLLTSSLDINNLGKWNNGMKIITIWSTSKASSFLNKIIKPLLHIFTLPYCLKRTNSIFCTYYYVQIMYNWRNLLLPFHRHFNACNNRLFYAIRKKLLICLNFPLKRQRSSSFIPWSFYIQMTSFVGTKLTIGSDSITSPSSSVALLFWSILQDIAYLMEKCKFCSLSEMINAQYHR